MGPEKFVDALRTGSASPAVATGASRRTEQGDLRRGRRSVRIAGLAGRSERVREPVFVEELSYTAEQFNREVIVLADPAQSLLRWHGRVEAPLRVSGSIAVRDASAPASKRAANKRYSQPGSSSLVISRMAPSVAGDTAKTWAASTGCGRRGGDIGEHDGDGSISGVARATRKHPAYTQPVDRTMRRRAYG